MKQTIFKANKKCQKCGKWEELDFLADVQNQSNIYPVDIMVWGQRDCFACHYKNRPYYINKILPINYDTNIYQHQIRPTQTNDYIQKCIDLLLDPQYIKNITIKRRVIGYGNYNYSATFDLSVIASQNMCMLVDLREGRKETENND